ncbi:hypothetical protein [Pseudomonas oryzihabitans]|uniref:hypothetical protein n=1 Tax=Pseudomonas oryzihabitans TaxID=47885 RepID=UPI00289398FE|nr:hypothetical protein [Pseudomonas oryzihabitans]MDT3721524.1 hypothetical protein [Pseudomonas oryzihabitans]
MDAVITQISQITDWEFLIALERSLESRGRLDMSAKAALERQGHLLSRRYLQQKGKLGNGPFSPLEDEVLDVLATATAALRRARRLPHNIVKSLRAGGLIEAVERNVCHAGALLCRTDFEADGIPRGTLERIVDRYPQAFELEARRAAARYVAEHEPAFRAVG